MARARTRGLRNRHRRRRRRTGGTGARGGVARGSAIAVRDVRLLSVGGNRTRLELSSLPEEGGRVELRIEEAGDSTRIPHRNLEILSSNGWEPIDGGAQPTWRCSAARCGARADARQAGRSRGRAGFDGRGSQTQAKVTDNPSPVDRARCMAQIRSKGMRPESAVRSMVHRHGYRFRLHRRDLPGTPDLVFPRHRAVIFVNGCFWHWHPDPERPIATLPKSNLGYWKPKLVRTRERDRENVAKLVEIGWRVLTVWECALGDPEVVLRQIDTFLSQGQARSGRGPRAI